MPNKQEENEPKKEVLDLIGGSPKKKRAPQPEPVPAPAPTPRPAPAKKEALDLLSGPKKKAPAPVPAEPAPESVQPAPAAAPAPQEEEPSSGDKVINLKPPVSVSELAALLQAKPFQIIKDLMGMGIFANRTRRWTLTPSVPSVTCTATPSPVKNGKKEAESRPSRNR